MTTPNKTTAKRMANATAVAVRLVSDEPRSVGMEDAEPVVAVGLKLAGEDKVHNIVTNVQVCMYTVCM